MKLLSCAVLALALSVGARASAEEARGVITGRVSDIANNVLPGATVHIEPHSVTVVTDREGAFTVSNLAPGDYTVEIKYVGFQPEKKTVKVTSGGHADVVAELRPRLFDEVTVTASRPSGEVKALNQQKTADNIVNVLPAEIIKSLPNNNVADAIGRLPSVSLERDEGEGKYVQIRGTDPRLSNVTINGAHIPSPEGSVRNIKLDVISSELVGAIELNKTLGGPGRGRDRRIRQPRHQDRGRPPLLQRVRPGRLRPPSRRAGHDAVGGDVLLPLRRGQEAGPDHRRELRLGRARHQRHRARARVLRLRGEGGSRRPRHGPPRLPLPAQPVRRRGRARLPARSGLRAVPARPVRGLPVRTSCGTTGLHLSLSPSIQRVTTTLDETTWPIFSIETNSSAKVLPKSEAACGDPGPDK
jgi:hypothetical protein